MGLISAMCDTGHEQHCRNCYPTACLTRLGSSCLVGTHLASFLADLGLLCGPPTASGLMAAGKWPVVAALLERGVPMPKFSMQLRLLDRRELFRESGQRVRSRPLLVVLMLLCFMKDFVTCLQQFCEV